MSKKDKLRLKLRNHPKGRTQQEVHTLLVSFGFELDKITGSHHSYIFSDGLVRQRIIIPIHRNQVKTEYVKDVIELIDKVSPPLVEETDDESNDED